MNLPDFSDIEIEQQFRAFMDSLDATPAPYETLILDGHLHRYDIAGEKFGNQHGAYTLHNDGLPAGYVHDWKKGTNATWVFDSKGLTQEQRDYFNSPQYKAEQETKELQRKKETLRTQAAAADGARIFVETLPPAPENHPYLRKKRIFPYGALLNSDNLTIPLRDINGNVKALQWIFPDGTKRFQLGAKISGHFWSIGLDTITPDDTDPVILIGEGFATMAKVYELTGKPSVAAISCNNLLDVAKALKGKYTHARIVAIADNDHITATNHNGFNPGLDAAQMLVKSHLAMDYVAPDFPQENDGTDWDDFALLHGDDYTAAVLNDKINYAIIPTDIKLLLPKITRINAQDLRQKVFPPVKWAVPNFIPEGLSILAGGPKVGKSILALHIAEAVALGGYALGKIPCSKGQVLYLALEDTQRRLQDRINGGEFGGDDDIDLSALEIITEIPRQNIGGTLYLEYWLSTHSNVRLVIIDTLQMFRKLLTGKGSMYSEDYEAISAIKKIADTYRVAILILHHLKKGMEGDWLSEISGSQGIAGAADTIFSLKRERNSTLATLHRTGRDVEEHDFIMKLDGFGWTLQDDAEAFTMPEWKRQILNFLKDNPSITAMQLSETASIPLNTAQQHLRRLAKEGLIHKTGYGTYGLPEESDTK